MTRWTRVCLVLLRLAIGWHFLFEGLEKLNTYEKTVKPAWSSETYLRESAAPGVLGDFFRGLPGDKVHDHYTVVPLPEGADPAAAPEAKQLPLAVEKDWRGFFDQFVAHYHLDPMQKDRAEGILKQHMDQTALWLHGLGEKGTLKVKRPAPAGNGTIEVTVTVPERFREYRDKGELLRQLEKTEGANFGLGAKKKVDQLKGEIRKIGKELQTAIADQTKAMADGLAGVLNDEQQQIRPALEPRDVADARLADMTEEERRTAADVNEPVGRRTVDFDRQDWIDFLTRWGLVVMGGLLLLGLFTRTSCVAGALFLVTLYLAMPPWPGAPELARMEGRFLINKNLIEALALVTLATTASGRWLGLDGLLQFLSLRRWRRAPTTPRRRGVTGKNSPTPYAKEAVHGH